MDKFLNLVNKFDKVIIQTHDNPDADAIASAFGLKHYMDLLGKDSEIVYYGKLISKPNLTEMVKQFDIPIINKDASFKVEDDELLVIVDGQRGSGNVKSFEAKNIACIDHHIPEVNYPYSYSSIQAKIGSCSTLIVNYLTHLGKGISTDVATALYFGLLMDTNNFVIKYTNMDRDCREVLESKIDKKIVPKLVRTSLTFDDIKVCSEAMGRIERYEDVIYSKIGDFDDNLLGHISDLVSEVAGINIVVLYSERKDGYKLSIRSYHDYISAEDIAVNLTEGIGSGGGHVNKAGGFIARDMFEIRYPNSTFDTHVKIKTAEFCKTLRFFEEGKDDPIKTYGEENFERASKKKYNVRYLKLEEYFGKDEVISVKTLEGTVRVKCDNYLIVGAKGEIYPITKELFNERYNDTKSSNGSALCDNNLGQYGVALNGQDRVVVLNENNLTNFNIAETTDNSKVLVKRVSGGIKVRTHWGDMIIRNRGYLIYVSKDNYYLCDEEVFKLTYKMLNVVHA